MSAAEKKKDRKKPVKSVPMNILKSIRAPRELETSDSSAGRILGVYQTFDLRNGHDGMINFIKKEAGLTPEDIKPGNFFVFFSSDRRKFKLFGANNTVIYHKSNHRIEVRAIKEIPHVFNIRKTFSFDDALSRSLDKLLPERIRKEVEMNS